MPTTKISDALKFLAFLGQSRPAVYTLGPNDQWPIFRAVTKANLQSILDEHVNTWYSVAVPKPGLQKKASKDEIVATGFLHCDLDPQDGLDPLQELNRLYTLVTDGRPGNVPPPSAIIESGRGVQCLWKLSSILPLPEHQEAVESANRWLIDQLHAPVGTHNSDRIMRLPGSWNCLDKKKLDKGYQPRQAHLLELNDRVYKLEDFGKWNPKESVSTAKPSASSGPKTVDDVTADPVTPEEGYLDKYPTLHARVKWLINNGHPGPYLREYVEMFGPIPEGRDPNNRSAWVYDVINQCIRAKVPDGDILGFLLDKRCRISDHIYDQTDPEYQARRQIARGHNTVAKDEPDDEETHAEVEHEPEEPLLNWDIDEDTDLPKNTPHNCRVAFQQMKVKLSYDEFADLCLINGRPIQDSDIIRIRFEIQTRFKFMPSKELFWDLVEDEARLRPFHPVKDYFNSLKWDGIERLDTWLTRYGGVEDSEYTRAVGALPLIAAVRRVNQPGAEFQEILTLVSNKQGTFKSTAIATLCPVEDWFSDDLPLNAETKEVIEKLQGHLVIECAETKGMKKGDDEHTKAFLSRRVDKARMAYGRVTKRAPRQCVFIATSNQDKLLRDPTGNRRWWPVTIGVFDVDALAADRDQLWAEAVLREKTAGRKIKLDKKLWGAAEEVQEKYTVEHGFVDTLARALDGKWGKILKADAWDLLGSPGAKSHEGSSQLNQAMRRLGWKDSKQRMAGAPQNCFVKDLEQDGGTTMAGKNGRWIKPYKTKEGTVEALYLEERPSEEQEHAF
jgi:hypothetical protein